MDAKQGAQQDSPEQLLDVFKAAALSVTKLYKSSVAAETKARADGYQECLDDLLAFLERDGPELGPGAVSKMKKWTADRRDGRDASPQSSESDDEIDKPRSASPPEPINDNLPQPPIQSTNDSSGPVDEPRSPQFIVPSRENFSFQSDHQYPNIELLDLSDTRSHVGVSHHSSRPPRPRPGKSGFRSSGHLGRGAGTKRRMDFDDFFGGCFGGKDPFGGGGGGKRSRHT